jgi:hypothetical protein
MGEQIRLTAGKEREYFVALTGFWCLPLPKSKIEFNSTLETAAQLWEGLAGGEAEGRLMAALARSLAATGA